MMHFRLTAIVAAGAGILRSRFAPAIKRCWAINQDLMPTVRLL